MASDAAQLVPTHPFADSLVPPGLDDAAPPHDPSLSRPWRSARGLSSGLADRAEAFLADAGFERAPWLAVAFAMGIAAWFVLPDRPSWTAFIGGCAGVAALAAWLGRGGERWPYLRQAAVVAALALAAGCTVIWVKSAVVGTPPIARPAVVRLTGWVEKREEQPADARIRLVLRTRLAAGAAPVRVRLNLPAQHDVPGLAEGAVITVRGRIMPPAPPMLPGGYDFARTAWFAGIAATGAVLGTPEVQRAAVGGGWLRERQRQLSAHVRARLGGSPGAIAAAFASGDRGAIAEIDDQAMRDAGLTHLLSISGLHVSAVVALAYVLALRLLALWPWLALRVRLPLVAAAAGAGAGVAYTLLTGAEVPTVRSCLGALLVLFALAAGREPLSLRLLAVAAGFVMMLWPEAVVGPSFQLSFGAVIAIVSLHSSAPVRNFLAAREEGMLARGARNLAMLLLTGLVIELALMPIGLFHFHRAGLYGALANVIAIPLTTFATMPLIALALILDIAGIGAPVWWLCGKSLELLLALAHWTADQPGAVRHLPAMSRGTFALFVGGLLWLALWRGRVRLWGLAPMALALGLLLILRAPDILVSGDGHQVAISDPGGGPLLVLRESRSGGARAGGGRASGRKLEGPGGAAQTFVPGGSFAARSDEATSGGSDMAAVRTAGVATSAESVAAQVTNPRPRGSFAQETLLEMAGQGGEVMPIAAWPGARCSIDACLIDLVRGGRTWRILVTRTRDLIEPGELMPACAAADIVIADRRLPRNCQPKWLKADRSLLWHTGGIAIDLAGRTYTTVAASEGAHGWWPPSQPRAPWTPRKPRYGAVQESATAGTGQASSPRPPPSRQSSVIAAQ